MQDEGCPYFFFLNVCMFEPWWYILVLPQISNIFREMFGWLAQTLGKTLFACTFPIPPDKMNMAILHSKRMLFDFMCKRVLCFQLVLFACAKGNLHIWMSKSLTSKTSHCRKLIRLLPPACTPLLTRFTLLQRQGDPLWSHPQVRGRGNCSR